MACSDITRCDNSLTAAAINVVLDVSNVLSYGECTIDGIKLGDRMLVDPNSTAEDLCRRLRSFKKIKKDRKWKKAKQTDKDNLKKLEGELCDLLKNILPEPSSNSGGDGEEILKEPEATLYGCLDPTATNYYCKENNCVDNKPPEGIEDVTCEYSQELAVENKYLFCNANECTQDTPGERVTPTNDIASWMNNGALDIDHIYKVKAGIKKVIEDVKPKGIFLKSKKGFYTRQLSKQLINEFANALTVTVFNTKFNKDNSYKTFPYTKVTVYGGNSQPMGQFRIEPNKDRNGESDSIKEITMRDSSTTLNNRFREEVGTEILDPNHESGMIKLFGPGGKFEDVRFTVKGGKIVTEDMEEGLGMVLKEEPIGLAKLLK